MPRRKKTDIEAEAVNTTATEVTEKETTTAKTKKTIKKKGGQELVEVATRGAWSEPKKSIHSNKLYVEIELLEPALGTTPGDENLLDSFIAKNAPDAASRQEEIEALGETEVAKKQTTVFMKGYFVPSENGEQLRDPLDRYSGTVPFDKETAVYTPFIWNYQLRGMFKDSCGLLAKAKYGESAGMSAFKKRIDGNIMVYPRRVALQLPESYLDNDYQEVPCDPKNLRIVQRPLRASTPQGERVSIASSEEVPAGTRLKFVIEYLNPDDRDAIIEWLNYGSIHGIGAWRNSGRGTFRWRELNPDFSPIV